MHLEWASPAENGRSITRHELQAEPQGGAAPPRVFSVPHPIEPPPSRSSQREVATALGQQGRRALVDSNRQRAFRSSQIRAAAHSTSVIGTPLNPFFLARH